MQQLLVDFVLNSQQIILWIAGFAIVFGVLEQSSQACNPGMRGSTRGFVTNMGYLFLVPLAGRFVRMWYISLGVYLLYYGVSSDQVDHYFRHGYGPLGALPLWAQAAIVFVLSDIILYWIHRLFHRRALWPFHAIHHSSPQVEWHSTYRFHPVNTWLAFTLVDTAMLFAGFSVEAVTLFAGFNMIYSAMVHANLNWTFGPFKYCFASPVFHRWHHTTQKEGLDKNFAPTFPLLDLLFGTYYMPEDRLPERYGVLGADIPEGFVAQLLWPFKQYVRGKAGVRSKSPPPA